MVKQISKQEYDSLNKAVSEFISSGKIISVCPRCGKPLIYENKGSLEIIRCEDTSCIKSIRRGI